MSGFSEAIFLLSFDVFNTAGKYGIRLNDLKNPKPKSMYGLSCCKEPDRLLLLLSIRNCVVVSGISFLIASVILPAAMAAPPLSLYVFRITGFILLLFQRCLHFSTESGIPLVLIPGTRSNPSDYSGNYKHKHKNEHYCCS